jgi:hypothetical protein
MDNLNYSFSYSSSRKFRLWANIAAATVLVEEVLVVARMKVVAVAVNWVGLFKEIKIVVVGTNTEVLYLVLVGLTIVEVVISKVVVVSSSSCSFSSSSSNSSSSNNSHRRGYGKFVLWATSYSGSYVKQVFIIIG